MQQITERTWITKSGYVATIVLTKSAHRCGYVQLPADHLAFGLNYYQTEVSIENAANFPTEAQIEVNDINIHGGLTYAGDFDNTDSWWFGFDAAHCDDYPDFQAADILYQYDTETTDLLNRRKGYTTKFDSTSVKSFKFMKQQCELLANQLATINIPF